MIYNHALFKFMKSKLIIINAKKKNRQAWSYSLLVNLFSASKLISVSEFYFTASEITFAGFPSIKPVD